MIEVRRGQRLTRSETQRERLTTIDAQCIDPSRPLRHERVLQADDVRRISLRGHGLIPVVMSVVPHERVARRNALDDIPALANRTSWYGYVSPAGVPRPRSRASRTRSSPSTDAKSSVLMKLFSLGSNPSKQDSMVVVPPSSAPTSGVPVSGAPVSCVPASGLRASEKPASKTLASRPAPEEPDVPQAARTEKRIRHSEVAGVFMGSFERKPAALSWVARALAIRQCHCAFLGNFDPEEDANRVPQLFFNACAMVRP